MQIQFHKYQAGGNDFIITNSQNKILHQKNFIAQTCNRRYGIGADGIIIINKHQTHQLQITYYNPDGTTTLCSNGSMCATHLAKTIGIITTNTTTFIANNKTYQAQINQNNIKLKIHTINNIQTIDQGIYIDTGTPHYIEFTKEPQKINLLQKVKTIRQNKNIPNTNISIITHNHTNQYQIRTYEKGVEAETPSCGTAAIAAAIAATYKHNTQPPIKIKSQTTTLTVNFKQKNHTTYTNITIQGTVHKVYQGTINTKQ